MGDPCGEQAKADHEKGGHSLHLEVQRENYKLKLKKKEKKDPVMDESILSDIFLASPFLHNSNSLMTRIRPAGDRKNSMVWERWFEIVRHKVTERTALLHPE